MEETLARIGGIARPPVRAIAPAPETFGYRNKMEFSFHPGPQGEPLLGLHERGGYDRVFAIETCLLPSALTLEIVRWTQRFAAAHRWAAYHPVRHQGVARFLAVRHLQNAGECAVGLVAASEDLPALDDWSEGIAGLSLFKEYLHNEKATGESFDEHGYFVTGDRVTLLEDGFIKFGDRAKDMLKVGGENVAASEIEQVIAVVPGVREAAVVAKKHPMLDEVPVVFIIPAAGVERAPKDLHDNVMSACRKALADFKVPREIRFVDEMPRSTLEKVAKTELRKMLG